MKQILLFTILLLTQAFTSLAQINTMEGDSTYIKAEALVSEQNQEKALQIALQEIDHLPIYNAKKAQWLIFIGDIFRDDSELDKALKYYHESYKINKHLQDSLALMQNHIRIGSIYHQKLNKNYDSLYSKKTLEHKDSSLFYYKKNIFDFKSFNYGEKYKATCYNNLAYIYSDYNKLDTAQAYITKSISIYKKKENDLNLIIALNTQGLIYIYQNNYLAAEKTHLNVLNKKNDTADINVLENIRISNSNLAYIYKKTKTVH